jgi:hypothetical protein
MLGPSIRGKHIHSTLPLGATSTHTSQSDRNPYSAIGGNGLPLSVEWAGRGLPVSLSVTVYTLLTRRGSLAPGHGLP